MKVVARGGVDDLAVAACSPCTVRTGRKSQTPIAIKAIVELGPKIQQGGRAAFGNEREMKFAVTRLPCVGNRLVMSGFLRNLREHVVHSANFTQPRYPDPYDRKSKSWNPEPFAKS